MMASCCIGRGRKIEQNKEIQMDRCLVPYVCVRDLLGPPEEGNMLGGRRFKARQPSELVFLTLKTAGLTPHNILLMIRAGTIQCILKLRKNKKKEKNKNLKKAIQGRDVLYLIITMLHLTNSPQGGRKSIHLSKASLYFRLIL